MRDLAAMGIRAKGADGRWHGMAVGQWLQIIHATAPGSVARVAEITGLSRAKVYSVFYRLLGLGLIRRIRLGAYDTTLDGAIAMEAARQGCSLQDFKDEALIEEGMEQQGLFDG